MEYRIEITPGYDCTRFECIEGSSTCNPGSGGFHGKHGATMNFIVRDKEGAISFSLYTHWLPEPSTWHVSSLPTPMPVDLGRHSLERIYESDFRMDECIITDKHCYYDGSALNAHEPFRVLCNEGLQALWVYLASVYLATYRQGSWPSPKPYKLKYR